MSDKPNYSQHEALDRSHTVLELFDSLLSEHPYVANDPELSAQANDIQDKLATFYQAIGSRTDE